MHGNSIRASLEAVGRCLGPGRVLEILIVGGAAGILTGQLSAATTTGDVDLLKCHLPQDRDELLDAAAAVGREMSLPASWMNEDVGLFAWTLPAGWEQRRVLVGQYGRLRVFAAGRLDLLAMKFLAHRPYDLEQLQSMRVTREELTFVQAHLRRLLAEKSGDVRRIEMAMVYADEWRVSDER